MISGLQLKVEGITNAPDAAEAARIGADYLGFVLYPKSPRAITVEAFKALSLPPRPPARVAVMVEPTDAELEEAVKAGFDRFQIHFNPDVPAARISAWSKMAGRDRLWLAPRLPLETDVAAALLTMADTFLLDAYDPHRFGGTGTTGNWEKFSRHQASHPGKRWILAGGLTPDNVAGAVRRTGARMLDVGSGLESAPGKKDHAKLAALASALSGAARQI